MAKVSAYVRQKRKKKVINLVRQFNAKLTRLSKSNPEMIPFLPERITVDKFMQETDAKRFNQLVTSYSRFLKPGYEKLKRLGDDVLKTKWEIGVYRSDLRRVNAKKKEKQKKVSYEKGNTRSIQTENLNTYTIAEKGISTRMFDMFRKAFENQLRSEYYNEMNKLYKQNYLTALERYWKDVKEYGEIKRIVSSLTLDLVGEAVYFDPVFEIGYYYQLFEKEENATRVLEYWREVERAYQRGADIEDIRQAFDDYNLPDARWKYLREKFPDGEEKE